jgi:hypothetical protein
MSSIVGLFQVVHEIGGKYYQFDVYAPSAIEANEFVKQCK